MSATTHHETTSADGTAIGYYRRGSGPSVVIVHGSVSTGAQWLPATDHLAQRFTCFVHDRRGRGHSGDAQAYDMRTEVADIAAMMAVAGPGAHLLGHSFGGLCALAFAETGRLDGSLVLFEPPTAVDGPVAGPALDTYRALVDAGDLEAAFEFALVNFVRVPPEAVPAIRETPLWASCVPLTPTWVRELREIDALGVDLDHYAAIAAPTHLLVGTDTTPFLYRSAQVLAKLVPGATLTELPGRDHFAHLVDPAGFSAAVVAAIR